MEEVYEALLELDGEYAFARARAEDGDILEMSRVQSDVLREMALDSVSFRLLMFEWSISSINVEVPQYLSVSLSSRGGVTRFRYDLSIGEGKLLQVEINKSGAAEIARS